MMLWSKLYGVLTALEALEVGREAGTVMNTRADRLLRYLRKRNLRASGCDILAPRTPVGS